MVTQYPDTISFAIPAEATLSSGEWTPGGAGSTVQAQGRYESASGSAMVTVADGKRVSYSGIVYLPITAPIIPEGTDVTIVEKRPGIADKTFKQTVLRFHRGQLNTRIWV